LQDTARSFGSNRADTERFRIYMEATQFDIIIERLKLSELDVDSMKSKIATLAKEVAVRPTPEFQFESVPIDRPDSEGPQPEFMNPADNLAIKIT
jgi:hypothetical protein